MTGSFRILHVRTQRVLSHDINFVSELIALFEHRLNVKTSKQFLIFGCAPVFIHIRFVCAVRSVAIFLSSVHAGFTIVTLMYEACLVCLDTIWASVSHSFVCVVFKRS